MFIHQDGKFKGPKETNSFQTNIATDSPCQTPWAYTGQGIDIEGTDEKCGNKAQRAYKTSKDIFGEIWGLKPKAVQ